MRRLSSGRTEAAVGCLCRLRDSFEAYDLKEQGEVSLVNLADVMKRAKVASPGISRTVLAFKLKLERLGLSSFTLPEFFEHFGMEIQELSGASVSVAEAFAMLRMHLSAADVRAAADCILRVIDTLLEHPTDPKYWQVNIRNEVILHFASHYSFSSTHSDKCGGYHNDADCTCAAASLWFLICCIVLSSKIALYLSHYLHLSQYFCFCLGPLGDAGQALEARGGQGPDDRCGVRATS